MNNSFFRAERCFAVLVLVAALGIIECALADEIFAPAELERLRQVSRAVLGSRAAERQRVLNASTVARAALTDVDGRLRTLEAAVRDDTLPHRPSVPAPPTAASASTLQLKVTAANIEPVTSKRRSLTPSIAAGSSRMVADASRVDHGTASNSAAVMGYIDDVLARVSEHRRSLSRRGTNLSANQVTSAARLRTTGVMPSGAPGKDAQARVTDALNVVAAELRRMRVHGADLRRLHGVRQQLWLSGPPATRELEPTFQTITRHYR